MNNLINCPSFVEEFVNYVISIKNYSESYAKNVVTTVSQFLTFINTFKFENKYETIKEMSLNEVRSLTNSDIYSYIYYLAENQYKSNSRNVKVEHLRSFFDYLYRIKHTLFKEPFKKIKREKFQYAKLPNYLSLDESKACLEVLSNSDNPNDIRDYAIFEVFLNCGLRVSELVNIKTSDIDFNNNTFRVIGKGQKERTCYLNEATKNAIQKYLEVRPKLERSNKPCEYLFTSFRSQQLDVSAVRRIVKRTYKKAKINNKDYSVHTLRHTCATLLYKSGTDIKILQELLGHSQVDTTEIYTHLHDEEVMNAMQTHPMSNFKMADALAYQGT